MNINVNVEQVNYADVVYVSIIASISVFNCEFVNHDITVSP